MSQEGTLSAVGSNPHIPTNFVTDSGTAVPSANTLNIFGGTDIATSAAGNTIMIAFSGASGVVTSVTGTAPITANGVSGSPQIGAITIALTTPVALNYGGTNANLTASNGGIFYSTATAGAILSGTATANQILLSGSSTTPAWSTATYPPTTTINQLLYSSSANVIAGLTAGNNGVLISSATGVPSWLADGTTGQVLVATTGSPPSWTSVAPGGVTSVTGTANQILASPTTGAVILSLIGPYTPATYTAHGVLVGEGTSSIVAVGPSGSTGQVLQNNAAADPSYSTATYPSTTTVNQLLYSSSTNVIGGITASANGVLISSNSNFPSWLANGTAGFVLTANSGAPPSWQTVSSSGAITTLTGNSGGAISPTAGNINTLGTGSITIVGSGSTLTTQLTGLTNHAVLVGAGTATITSVGPSGSTGQILQNNASADPSYSTATYPSTTTAFQLLVSTATNVVGEITAASSGTVLAGVTGAVPAFTATPTVTSITINNAPSAGTDGTNKTYVDTAIAAVNPATSVYAATTTNIPGTYTGLGGIGDTFLTTATGAFTLDGTTPPLLSRILFKDQSTTFQNGVYILTTNGTGITGSLFTRALDYDQPSDINSTGVIAVLNGTVNKLTGWLINVVVASVGVSPITYTLFSSAPVSYPLSLANGGTNASLTASNGGIFYSTASAGAILSGTATANQVLLSGSSTTPAWSTATYPATTTINQILYSSSTNIIAGLATANQGVLTTGTGGVPVITAIAVNGQIIIGSTAGAPAAATLTAGAGIAITNGSNSISIACVGGGFTWQVIGASQTLAVANGYFCTTGAALSLALPAVSAVGDSIAVVLDGSTSWTITQPNAATRIRIGSQQTTLGVSGTLASTAQGDTVELVCETANGRWVVTNSMGNITIV